MRPAFIVDLSSDGAAEALSADGVFVPNATVEFDEECHIVLRAGSEDLAVIARAVQINEAGAGFQIDGMTRELRERIAALLAIAKQQVDLERKKTMSWSAGTDPSRRAAGSIPPISRRSVRIAEGSLSPVAVKPADTDSDTES